MRDMKGWPPEGTLVTLGKIVAVVCDKTLPDDVALSEIQDYLILAGYDVPLRSYRVAVPAPQEPTT